MKDRLDFAIRLSRRVGNVILGNWGNPERLGTKKDFQDLVTEMDELSQSMIVDSIKRNFPGEGIIAEEGVNEEKDHVWIIDPIDGTVNYAFGLPSFSISIAYMEDGVVKIGVVHLPKLGETYYARLGEGAYMNGERIGVSSRDDLKRSLGLLGFFRGFTHRVLRDFEDRVVRMRILGSIAVAIVYVAAGKADFAIAKRANLWDIAAASLILKEAGGRMTDFDGNDLDLSTKNGFVFSNSLIHDLVLERMRN